MSYLCQLKVSEGKGKYKVDLFALKTFEGLIILATGGEKPHVGAVAIAIPRPSLKNPKRTSVTTSTFTLVGHKDDEIAKIVAEAIAKEFNEVTVVVAGIHIEKAQEKDINQLVANTKKAVKNLIHELPIRLIKNCARAPEKMAPSVLIKSFPELAHDVNSLTKLCCY